MLLPVLHAMKREPTALPGGTEVDGYRVDAVVGKGGSGAVYRATEVATGRTVAIKLLSPELGEDAEWVERFRREAMSAATLKDPHVVEALDIGTVDGLPYLVFEFVEGRSLDGVIAAGALPESQVVEIGLQVSMGLLTAEPRAALARLALR